MRSSRFLIYATFLTPSLAAIAAIGGEEQCGCSLQETRQWTFDSKDALAGWTVTGDVGFDSRKSREGQRGALRIGPGGKALIKLRDKAESGKFELWVYDDGTTPENAKAARVGPRWGLLENDAKVLAAGILYNSYLGGDEGYTATLYDGNTWFNQLFWLGVNRTPPEWHKWTFDFDPEAGLQALPQRQGTRRRRSRQGRSQGIHLDRHLGRPERRPRAEHLGLQRHRDVGRAGQGRGHRRRGRSL